MFIYTYLRIFVKCDIPLYGNSDLIVKFLCWGKRGVTLGFVISYQSQSQNCISWRGFSSKECYFRAEESETWEITPRTEATLAGIQVFNWSKARRSKDQRGESDQKQWGLRGWNEVTTGSYAEEARRDKWVTQTDYGKYEQANQPLVAHHFF